MQLVNERFVDSLPAATPDMKPLCFPGEYPTRLWIRTGTRTYLGKPTVEMVERLIKALLTKESTTEFIEFDRHAKFFGYANHKLLGTNEYFAWYHPTVVMSIVEMRAWLGRPFHTLRAGKHVFYSTYPKSSDKALLDQIEARFNPQAKPKPEPTRPKPTYPRPRKQDFASYGEYVAAYAKWKSENAEYVAFTAKEKKGHIFENYTTYNGNPW